VSTAHAKTARFFLQVFQRIRAMKESPKTAASPRIGQNDSPFPAVRLKIKRNGYVIESAMVLSSITHALRRPDKGIELPRPVCDETARAPALVRQLLKGRQVFF
jgi:hypothetical protein